MIRKFVIRIAMIGAWTVFGLVGAFAGIVVIVGMLRYFMIVPAADDITFIVRM